MKKAANSMDKMIALMFEKNKCLELGMQFSGRILAQHVQDTWFNLCQQEKKIHSIKNKLNNKFVKSGLSGLCTWPMCTQDSLSKCSLVVPGLVAMWEFSLVYLSSCTLCFMYFLCVCPYITAFQSNEERIKSLSPYECFHCRKPGRYITHRS